MNHRLRLRMHDFLLDGSMLHRRLVLRLNGRVFNRRTFRRLRFALVLHSLRALLLLLLELLLRGRSPPANC